MTETSIIPPDPQSTPETSIASSIIPWPRDDARALYFGYRASGLSVREALNAIKRSKPWLSIQRRDVAFTTIEKRLPEIRRELSKEYLEIEFFRNFRLILEKDHQVIKKSLNKADELTRHEHEYLIKMRSQYTPAQIQILEQLVEKGQDGLNFAQWIASNPDIVQMSRTDTVTVMRGQDDEE